MTLPYERTRSVIQARDFLRELKCNPALPEVIRNEAHRLLRHYPSASDMTRAAMQERMDPHFLMEPVFGIEDQDR